MSKLPALSSIIFHSHVVAVDSAVPALKAVVDPLLPSCGQTAGYDLEDGSLFDNLVDSVDENDDGDDEVHDRVVCPLMPQRRALRGEPSDAIQVLDISVSVAAAESTGPEDKIEAAELGVLVCVSPIKVSTAVPSVNYNDPSSHCSYRKGQCVQPRTLKRNGSLHTLCALHREKSIANQKTFDGKKRSVPEPESAVPKKMGKKTTTRTTETTKTTSKKTKSRAQPKKAARGKSAAPPQSTPKRQRKARQPANQTRNPSSTMDNAVAAEAGAKSREVEARECSKEQQQPALQMAQEEQDERDFFAEFTRVLDGRQLSKAKQLAVTQFLRDVLL